jgi:hypothetical protein
MALRDVAITPGSGDSVRFDGGNQVVKLAYGAENTETLMAGKPATEAAQDTGNASLGSILAKLLAAPATEAKQDTIVSSLAGLLRMAVRRDSDDGTAADGGLSALFVNDVGRLKVSTMPGMYALVTGTITANAQTVFADVSRSSNVQIHMVATALSNSNVTFEGSIDSTTGSDGAWFAIQAVRSNANTIELTTGNLSATPAYAWEASVNGLSYFRVRATAHTSGTATWKIQRGSYATEPIPAAQVSGTQAVSGTVTVATTTNIPSTGQGASTNHRTAHVANITTGVPTLVKNSVGVLNSGRIANNSGVGVWFHLHNKATAPTVGTDTPEESFWVAANSTLVLDCGPFGARFATGIGYTICDNCAAIPVAGGTIAIATTAAAICVSLRYT